MPEENSKPPSVNGNATDQDNAAADISLEQQTQVINGNSSSSSSAGQR